MLLVRCSGALPSSNQWYYTEDRIVIGSALKTSDQTEAVIPLMNLIDEPPTLYQGTWIGEAHVISKCDRAERLLLMTPRYDDSEDSEDEGCLRYGRVKYHPAAMLQGGATFQPPWVDTHMDPARISADI